MKILFCAVFFVLLSGCATDRLTGVTSQNDVAANHPVVVADTTKEESPSEYFFMSQGEHGEILLYCHKELLYPNVKIDEEKSKNLTGTVILDKIAISVDGQQTQDFAFLVNAPRDEKGVLVLEQNRCTFDIPVAHPKVVVGSITN